MKFMGERVDGFGTVIQQLRASVTASDDEVTRLSGKLALLEGSGRAPPGAPGLPDPDPSAVQRPSGPAPSPPNDHPASAHAPGSSSDGSWTSGRLSGDSGTGGGQFQ